MRESRAVIISFVIDEDLCFVFEATECGGVDDAIDVAMKSGTEGTFLFAVIAAQTF